jgi:hypothetical protein
MKTSEMQGAALDWAVAKCEGHDAHYYKGIVRTTMQQHFGPECKYSTDWAQGGPIIEREKIELDEYEGTWHAFGYHGPTPLIAAMRCYVASKLGDEIELPEGLE